VNRFEAMYVLLDDYRDKLKITEEVIKAIAGNEQSGAELSF
jgi:hypothetical protein